MADIAELVRIMERLRNPHTGCPWDLQQTFESIAPYTVEEAYEVADAIDQDDPQALCEELGDLLFQVVFHSQLAKEAGWFDIIQVINSISEKLIQRHPHVFSNQVIGTAKEQSVAWETFKQLERSKKNYKHQLDGVPNTLPAMLRAIKLQKRAAMVNFDWSTVHAVLEKVKEEVDELDQAMQACNETDIRDELGDLLFSCVNLARHLEVDPELALKKANHKFETRFIQLQELVEGQGKSLESMTIKELSEIWDQVKSEEIRVKAAN